MTRSTNVFGGNGKPSRKRKGRPTGTDLESEQMEASTIPTHNQRESINTDTGISPNADMTMNSPRKRRRLPKIELTDTEIETIKTLLESIGGPDDAMNFEENMATDILRKVLLTV